MDGLRIAFARPMRLLLLVPSVIVLAACSDNNAGGPSDMSAAVCAGQAMPQCGAGRTAVCLANMWHCEGPGVDMATAALFAQCVPDPGAFEMANGSRGNCAAGLFCCPTGCPANPDGGSQPCDPIPRCEMPFQTVHCPPQ
jgi:hypothetical protein